MTFTDEELKDFWQRALKQYAMETKPASNDPREAGGLLWWIGMQDAYRGEGRPLSVQDFVDLMAEKGTWHGD